MPSLFKPRASLLVLAFVLGSASGQEDAMEFPTLTSYIASELAATNSALSEAVTAKRYKEAATLKSEKDSLTVALASAEAKVQALSRAEAAQDFETCSSLADEMGSVVLTPEGLKVFEAAAAEEAVIKKAKEDANLVVDKSGNTELILASKNGDVSKTRQLIAAGADLDKKNDDGMTALMWAARKGIGGAVKLLVDAGANKAIIGRDGIRTALHWAAEEGHVEVAKLLVGEDIAKNRDGWRSLLMWSAEEGHSEVAKMLIDAGSIKGDKN